MEREVFLNGYCRALDHSRIVTAELDETTLLDVDCNYGTCPYAPSCSIAESLRQLSAPK